MADQYHNSMLAVNADPSSVPYPANPEHEQQYGPTPPFTQNASSYNGHPSLSTTEAFNYIKANQQLQSGTDVVAMGSHHSSRLHAQLNAYRSIAQNGAPTPTMLNHCFRPPPADQPVENGFDPQFANENTSREVLRANNGNDEILTPANLMKLFSMRQQRKTQVAKPLGIDPVAFYQEREVAVENRIALRIKELEDLLPAALDEQQRQKALTELYSLRLVNMQRRFRSEVLHAIRPNANLQTAKYLHLYYRPKTITLADARQTERIEQKRRLELDAVRKSNHQQFLNAILKRHTEMRDTQLHMRTVRQRLNKNVITWHANAEVRQKREAERQERERMRRLMEEDEDGYRKLIDEKKHKRLAYLLKQTDEYVDSLAVMVHQHKSTLRRHKEISAGGPGGGGGGGEAVDAVSQDSTDSLTAAEESTKMDTAPAIDAVVEPAAATAVASATAVVEVVNKQANVPDDEYVPLQPGANANYYQLAHTLKEEVKQQPAMMRGGQLKEYQVAGLEWLVSLYNNNLNGILADEMGLGKTIQTIALVSYLVETKNVRGPYLIIVPLSTMSNWMLEFDRWSPTIEKIAYKGTPQVRKSLQYKIRQHKFQVLLTTYEYVIRDKGVLSKINWKYMIIDEGHRMKNHHCKLTVTLNTYYKAPQRLLLTGTPLQNKLPELWALLNFILPSIFKSCDNFEQWFNAPFQTTGEKVNLNEEESMLIIRRLHKVLRPFLLRRLKKEVESQLPEKCEHIVKCDMSALQRAIYTAMQRRGVLIHEAQQHKDGKSARKATALQNTLMQLRKICNHPFMFEKIETSYAKFRGYADDTVANSDIYRAAGKFELLERILPKLFATNHKVLIFCQMTTLMTIMEDYFQWRNWKYMRLDGTTKADDRSGLLKKFSDPEENYFIFMLSTRAGGLGLNLQTADTVIIFDSDWNPHQDLQAQDRAHRIGQKNEVRVLRLITAHSIEEKILAAAQYKLGMDKKIIQAGMFNQRSTHSDRENFLKDILTERVGSKRKSKPKLASSISANKSASNLRRMGSVVVDGENSMMIDGENSCSQKEESNSAAEGEEEMSVDEATCAELAEDEEEDDEDEFPDDEQLNEFIARGEAEMTLFTRMDMERKKHEALQPGGPLAPLIEEKELPDFLSKMAEEIEKDSALKAANAASEAAESGAGRRARKGGMVNYADDLSEADFLRACEEGNYDDLGMFAQKRGRRAAGNGSGGGGGGGGGYEQFEGPDSDDEDSIPPPKRKRGRPSRASQQAAAVASGKTLGLSPDMLEQANAIVEKLLNFEDEDGRNLSTPFKRLPTRADLPDYYEVIDKPMDFRRIQLRLKRNDYTGFDEFCAEIDLMFQNAQTYNREDSQIYLDAVVLSEFFPTAREQALKEFTAQREKQGKAESVTAEAGEDEETDSKPAKEDEPKSVPLDLVGPALVDANESNGTSGEEEESEDVASDSGSKEVKGENSRSAKRTKKVYEAKKVFASSDEEDEE